MPYQNPGQNRLQQSVSLLPRHLKALDWLTEEAGETNKSATIRLLLESAMRQRFGPDWLSVIKRDEVDAEAEKEAVAS